MNVAVIGSGGREHAIITAIKHNKKIDRLYAIPGNGGIAKDAVCVDIAATDIPRVVAFAKNNDIDYVIVAPDDPLVLGMVDALNEAGIECFGPDKKAAAIEGSKAFSKWLMQKYGIPTAKHMTFSDEGMALEYIDGVETPIVVKADGLALGKGVIICETRDEAKNAVREMMELGKFGASGNTVVIEEFLEGPEVSVLAFTDGETIIPMISAMDHKRAHDNDEGLNTGGMGAVAPNPYFTKEIANECMEKIFVPTMLAMNAEGRPFKGVLFFGLMLTKNGPFVIEYNCRFGDPEAQVVLPLMQGDLLDTFLAISRGKLKDMNINFSEKSACCVVIASEGYPVKYDKGFELSLPEVNKNEYLYVAGAKLSGDKLVSSGGRVVGATYVGDTLKDAIDGAYALAGKIKLDNGYCRSDIGARAMKVVK